MTTIIDVRDSVIDAELNIGIALITLEALIQQGNDDLLQLKDRIEQASADVSNLCDHFKYAGRVAELVKEEERREALSADD